MSELLSRERIHVGAVRGRYFRENFAQGGVDLAQIIPELVTNADAAIASSGHERRRIQLSFSAPAPGFVERWREQMRALRVPALTSWRFEVRCSDDGIGVDAAAVDRRLGTLGELPEHPGSQRGLFGRGLRDVWLAQGAGRIEGARGGRAVESWFFPASGDDPYAYLHVRDEPAPNLASGTAVTVPFALERLPVDGRLRTLVCQLVQLRPVLEDPARELVLGLPSGQFEHIQLPEIEPCQERPVLFDDEIKVTSELSAHVTVRRSAAPLPAGTSRATRLGGLVIRSGRAAHESTFAAHEGMPGTRHLYGEVRCDALEHLQRAALNRTRPQLVVKVDRSGLNEHHPAVRALYEQIDRILKPIVAEEDRRASAQVIRPGSALKARDQVGLRALNDALKTAFDGPGKAAFSPGGQSAATAATTDFQDADDAVVPSLPPDVRAEATPLPFAAALRFKTALMRLHPGERRGITLLADPTQVRPGSVIRIAADHGLSVNIAGERLPDPVRSGFSRLDASVRARVTCEPGARLSVHAEVDGYAAELVVLVVRHHASGWVREIARKDEDNEIEAAFDPESGVVTVYEGRREFKALERAARRSGLPKNRVRDYLPYRMLEVEVAASAVYAWAAAEILARRHQEERPQVPPSTPPPPTAKRRRCVTAPTRSSCAPSSTRASSRVGCASSPNSAHAMDISRRCSTTRRHPTHSANRPEHAEPDCAWCTYLGCTISP
jgi:hypothetical protein